MEDSPVSAAALHLLLKLVRDSLNEQTYLADLAGLQYEVSHASTQFLCASHALMFLDAAAWSMLMS